MRYSKSTTSVIVSGLVIWIAGIILVRLVKDYVLVDGGVFILAYILAAISGPPTVWCAAILSGYRYSEMVRPILLIAGLDLILDGFVMGFIPEIYVEQEKIIFLAPLFLWAFGWACISAIFMSAKDSGAEK